ncbi:MAG: M13 family metallopeptidase, partial [Muribaculaceae bacterium]|nr:M13 family metallopeptidase [Muribaculaceae bacterium]
MKILKIALAMTIALTGCTKAPQTKSLDLTKLSDNVSAGEDFYLYVNQNWMNEHPLTGEYARFGNFDLLRDTAQERVRQLVLDVAKSNPEEGTVAYKVATVFNLAMDSTRRNAEGARPIRADLNRIEATPADSMTELFMWMHGNFASPFFGAGPMENFSNSNEYAMYSSGGGMGLGDRDYYLENDERNTTVREAYK